jgi:REP element-mobilizing transposase RayT
MANTYTQIHLQLVFAVKYREALLDKKWRDDLGKYINGIIQKQNHKPLIINGVEDHLHLLIGQRPHQSLSDLMQDIKGSSSKWINDNHLTKKKFEWQGGYGAFSYKQSYLPTLINYIKNQESHHKKERFIDEYKKLLKLFEVEFDERYILTEPM